MVTSQSVSLETGGGQASEPNPMSQRNVKARLGSKQLKALAFIRQHPNCSTTDIAMHMELRIRLLMPTLMELVEKRLIGRQRGLGFGEYESTWLAEVADE